jgi:hypothetical protein
MTKTFLFLAALCSIVVGEGMAFDAYADGTIVVRHPKKVRTVAIERVADCARHRCFLYRRPVCPGGYGCYSLYGAYGPFGGAAYWNRFNY